MHPGNQYQPGLSFDDYRAIGADSDILTVNASILKKPTALEMWMEMNKPNDGSTTPALALGDALHKAVLEPKDYEENFDDHYLNFTETKGLDTKKAAEARLIYPGKILVNQAILEGVEGMAEAIQKHHLASNLIGNCSEKELSGVAYDPEFNIVRKIRVDAAPGLGPGRGNFLLDLKTTRKITLHQFKRQCLDLGYHMAAAYYLDTDAMITGQPVRENFYFVAVHNVKPYMARVYALRPEDIEKGRDLYKERLGILTQAYADNQFCAYEHESDPIDLLLFNHG